MRSLFYIIPLSSHSFETFKMSRKEVAFLRPFIINILQNVATKLGIKSA